MKVEMFMAQFVVTWKFRIYFIRFLFIKNIFSFKQWDLPSSFFFFEEKPIGISLIKT
jgi:hypothetical protein